MFNKLFQFIIKGFDIELLMSYFWITNTTYWLEIDYDHSNNNKNTHPLKRFKLLNKNYEYNNILDVYQQTKSMKAEELTNVLGIKLISNSDETDEEILNKLRGCLKLMQDKQKSKYYTRINNKHLLGNNLK